MGQEIRTQIESIQRGTMSGSNINKQQQQQHHQQQNPQHFTFNDQIIEQFDKVYESEQDEAWSVHGNTTRSKIIDSELKESMSKNSVLEGQIKMLKEALLEKKTELKSQQEKTIKEVKNCEQKYKEKNQVERLHFENSQRLLKHKHNEELKKIKKDVVQVKSDARLVIDFVRRKANEAIADESLKIEQQKKSMGKKMEALESQMKRTFHSHLHTLEEEVKMVVRKEKKAIDLTILPPPPPKNISIAHRRMLNSRRCSNVSIPTDESEAPDLCSDDSISTSYSDVSGSDQFSFMKHDKDKYISDQHEILKSRVQELEQWTDTLTLALRNGAKIKGSDLNSGQKTSNKKTRI
jgi:hypothetical protein